MALVLLLAEVPETLGTAALLEEYIVKVRFRASIALPHLLYLSFFCVYKIVVRKLHASVIFHRISDSNPFKS